MIEVLAFLLIFLGIQDPSDGLVLETRSLSRQDVPEYFPYQMLTEDFAILLITLENHSAVDWSVEVDKLEVYSKKGERMKRALPTDITPKVLKFYKGATIRPGHPEQKTVREEAYGEIVVGAHRGQPIVSMDTVEKLGDMLESHQIHDASIAPGETLEGFYYLKSKEGGNKLKDGWVILQGLRADF